MANTLCNVGPFIVPSGGIISPGPDYGPVIVPSGAPLI